MIRQYILFFTALIALLGALVAALATIQQRDFTLRGYVDPTQTQALPFRIPRLGVNAELTQYNDSELREQFDRMNGHVTWVRQFVRWDEIEPQQGEYDWSVWDRIVETIADYSELELVTVFVNSPDWARSRNTTHTAPPDDPADFAAFVTVFTERYGDVVDTYQIWDEPNIYSGWGEQEPRVADYVALLQSGYEAVHAHDARKTVIAAALAPTSENTVQNISDITYLESLYALGASKFADAFAGKPYGFDLPPVDRSVANETLNFSRLVALREVMVANGDADKHLWASHWGWNNLPEDWTGTPSIWGQVSPEQQIQYTLQAFDRAEREWPWLGGMVLHHWQPDAPPDDPQWGFALIDQQGQPSVLWQHMVNRPTPQHATNGLYPARNPHATYNGTWTFSDFGADIGWVQDSRLAFDFTGTDVALLLREDDYVSYLYPTLDNGEANALPNDTAGNPYILLRTGDLQPETKLVTVARDLEHQAHRLRIVADELIPDEVINRWPLVGFAVSDGDLREPYNRQITVAWVAALIAGVGVLVTAWRTDWTPVNRPFGRLWHGLGDAGQLLISIMTSLSLLAAMLITWGDGIPTLFRRDSVQLGLSVLTSGVIYINEPGVIFTILAVLLLFVIVYHRLELGLMLTLFWSPFFLFPVELYRFAFPIVEVILLITAAAWVLRLLNNWALDRQAGANRYSVRVRLIALDYVMLSWVLVGALTLTWAARIDLAMTEFRTLFLQPALFYVILRTTIRTRQQMLLLVDALTLAGFVVAAAGLLMYVRGEAIITAEAGARRLASVYGSPNNVGLFLGRCMPLALVFVLFPLGRARRIAATVALLTMLLAAALSQSAGALFLGIPAAIIGVLVLAWRRRALLPVATLVVIGAVGLLIALEMPRFSRVLSLSEGTNFYRVRVWESTINLIEDQPLTGVGLDQFLYAFRDIYILPDAWEEPDLSHPHNILLDFWVRLGLLGVMLLLAFQLFFWRRAMEHYRHLWGKRVMTLAILVGVMGSMLNLLAHGLVDNSIYVLDLAYVFAFLNGASANIGAIDDSL